MHKNEIQDIKFAYHEKRINENINDILIYFYQFISSINTSNKFGIKRANDPIDDYDKENLSYLIKNPLSTRAQIDLIRYSQAFAWLLGYEEVSLQHLLFVLPHILAHRIEFNDSFSMKHIEDKRDVFFELHLAKQLVKNSLDIHFKNVVQIKNVIHQIQMNGKSNFEVNHITHPFIKELVTASKKNGSAHHKI